jgi:hypothetical protein
MTGRADRTSEETNKKEKEKEEEADSIRRLKSASSSQAALLIIIGNAYRSPAVLLMGLEQQQGRAVSRMNELCALTWKLVLSLVQ